jgi:cytochrome P450
LKLPGLVLVNRYDDCMAVLQQHEGFTVALYGPKQAGFWMAEDETPRHWREEGVMRSVLDLEDLPRLRAFSGERAATLLSQAGGQLDAVLGLSRAVPVALVQEMFGYDQSDPAEIRAWSFWNQYDAFYNQPFHASSQIDPSPEQITAERQAANVRLGDYLKGLLQRRAAQLAVGGLSEGRGDPATRLLRLSQSGAVDFDIQRVARNVGGLLIGTIETTSQAVIHALSFLLADAERREAAVQAAHQVEGEAIDGHVMEALRFHPPFPYFFRVCEQPTQLGLGMPWEQTITPGTTMLTLNHSAMFDPTGFPDPHQFEPDRNQSANFLFGHGHHQCLGRHIGAMIIPEIVRQVLRLPDIEAADPVDRGGGPFPEHFPLRWTACEG